MEVNPKTLLFTQDSIKNTFKAPRAHETLDDAVTALRRGRIKASDFPRLNVVSYEGHLWSLDNRRLWVFKKARVGTITVNVVPSSQNPRFTSLISNLPLKNKILQPGYRPRVRGQNHLIPMQPIVFREGDEMERLIAKLRLMFGL